jgi:hypothetical protein
MKQANGWLVVFVLAAMTAPACGGGSGECTPTCGHAFECYFGVCVPRGPDSGHDGTIEAGADGDADAPPRDDGTNADAPDVLPEGGGCTGPEDCADGDPCTQDLCDPSTGICQNPAAPDGTPCTDDANPCTQDVCMGGYCAHPVAPGCCITPADCEDGDPCTTEDCVGGTCTSEVRPDCCTRDADCMWLDHLWECDAGSMTCYDPPAGEFCDTCTTRVDCGDGGPASDDWCMPYGASERGCTKDCIDDLDCPGAALCASRESRPCAPGEAECLCVSRFNSCAAFNHFGDWCFDDGWCDDCTGCRAFVCRDGGCTSPCDVEHDCPWGWTCAEGICVGAG